MAKPKFDIRDALVMIELHPQRIPHPIDFAEQHQLAVDLATSAFMRCQTEKEELAPAWAAYCPNGFHDIPGPLVAFCATPWHNARHKDMLLEGVRHVFHDIGATRYSFWAEAWFVTRTPSEYDEMLKGKRPSVSVQDDRREMLNVITVDKDHEQPLAANFEIIRPWDGSLPSLVLFDDDKEAPFEHFEGRMCELLK